MGKKKNTRSVVITIIITLIVLGCLTFAAIKFLIPAYANAHEGEGDVQYKIYVIAVKLFPLLVGIVLIVIAAMIANSRDDEEDEEDMLPPNSYDSQLFEKPADDPTSAAPAAAVPGTAEPVAEKKEEEFFEIFADAKEEKPEENKEDFMAIFGADEPEKEEEEKEEEEKEEEEPATEDVFSSEVLPEPEAEPEQEPAPEPAPAVAAAPVADDSDLIAAIYALVRKLDNITDLVVVEEEEFEEPEEIPEDVPEEPETTEEDEDRAEYEKCPVEPAPEEEKKEAAPATVVIQDDGSVLRIENKIDKLCDIVANLATIIATQAMNNVQAPAAPVEPVVEKQVETVPVEVPVDQQLNDIDVTDPFQLAKVEFDSSRECEYDITCAFTTASVADVMTAISETAYAFDIKGRTVVIIPFLDKDEAVAELDKIGKEYESVFTAADDIATFDEVVAARL